MSSSAGESGSSATSDAAGSGTAASGINWTSSGFWPGYFDTMGWGFGMSVRTRRTHLGPSVGSYGWPGSYGTAWYNDPAEDLTAIFVMQRAHAGEQTLPMWLDMWTAVYQAIDE